MIDPKEKRERQIDLQYLAITIFLLSFLAIDYFADGKFDLNIGLGR